MPSMPSTMPMARMPVIAEAIHRTTAGSGSRHASLTFAGVVEFGLGGHREQWHQLLAVIPGVGMHARLAYR
jgi:hypothetical protein